MENPMDILNVPAFKRKRSLSAKARKTSQSITMAELRPAKKTRKRYTRKTTVQAPVFDEPLMDIGIQEDVEQDSFFPEVIRKRDERNVREMKFIGQCEGYFDRINVAVLKLTAPLRSGDSILFETADGMFEQPIDSMQ
ncbi:MAG: hypothetical protein WC269_02580, partial [Candidatus Gracilibacteria bacterium]